MASEEEPLLPEVRWHVSKGVVGSRKGKSNSAITSYAHRLWNRILRKPKLCPTCQKPMRFVKITGPDDDQVTHDWVCETCDVTPDEEMEEEGP